MDSISKRQLEIIQAAGKILTQSGIHGLTIKNLAKEMKFTESAIYRHFESKEAIIITMLNYLVVTMDERLSNATKETDLPIKQIEVLFQNQIAFFKENPHFLISVFSDGLLEESEKINECIHGIMQVKSKHIIGIIKAGQDQKVITSKVATEELTHIIMGGFRLLMYKWRLAHFKFDITLKGEHYIKSILELIQIR
ncbi:MAG: TetR/AcrR family transcriptional regulator [Chitinophagaceae bacterium]|nr:TetR/AcrR family transcriptional regulator [Chitinophagaceae bacterium]